MVTIFNKPSAVYFIILTRFVGGAIGRTVSTLITLD